MINIEEIKSKVQYFEEQIEQLRKDEENVNNKKGELAEKEEALNRKYDGIGDNPFKIQEKESEEKIIGIDREKIEEEANRIITEKRNLNNEFIEFTDEFYKRINEEKDRIKAEAANPEKSINELKTQKQELLEKKKMHEERVAYWEEKNINPKDTIYRRLKEEIIPQLDERIEKIDNNLEELKPEFLSEQYDNLQRYEKVLQNKHMMEYKIEDLKEVLGLNIKNQEPLEQKDEGQEQSDGVGEGGQAQVAEVGEDGQAQIVSDNNSQQPKGSPRSGFVPTGDIKAETGNEKKQDGITNGESFGTEPGGVGTTASNNINNTSYGQKNGSGISPSQQRSSKLKDLKITKIKISKDGVVFSTSNGRGGGKVDERIDFRDVSHRLRMRNPSLNQVLKLIDLRTRGSRLYIGDGIYIDSFGDISDNPDKYKDILKNIVTIDRKGIDYTKLSTIIPKIMRRDWYRQMKEIGTEVEQYDFAQIVPDEPGPIRKFFDKIKQKALPGTSARRGLPRASKEENTTGGERLNGQTEKVINRYPGKRVKPGSSPFLKRIKVEGEKPNVVNSNGRSVTPRNIDGRSH